MCIRDSYSACGGGVAEGTSRGKNAPENIATATRVENAGGKIELFTYFCFEMRRYLLKNWKTSAVSTTDWMVANSTLQAAWYFRHVRWAWLILCFIYNIKKMLSAWWANHLKRARTGKIKNNCNRGRKRTCPLVCLRSYSYNRNTYLARNTSTSQQVVIVAAAVLSFMERNHAFFEWAFFCDFVSPNPKNK